MAATYERTRGSWTADTAATCGVHSQVLVMRAEWGPTKGLFGLRGSGHFLGLLRKPRLLKLRTLVAVPFGFVY